MYLLLSGRDYPYKGGSSRPYDPICPAKKVWVGWRFSLKSPIVVGVVWWAESGRMVAGIVLHTWILRQLTADISPRSWRQQSTEMRQRCSEISIPPCVVGRHFSSSRILGWLVGADRISVSDSSIQCLRINTHWRDCLCFKWKPK